MALALSVGGGNSVWKIIALKSVSQVGKLESGSTALVNIIQKGGLRIRDQGC